MKVKKAKKKSETEGCESKFRHERLQAGRVSKGVRRWCEMDEGGWRDGLRWVREDGEMV